MSALPPARWDGGDLPGNVRAGPGTVISSERAFRRFRGRRDPAIVIGARCTIDGAQFNVGEAGLLEIGDCCAISDAVVLLVEESVRIGSHVALGWNVTVADSDFHPVGAAERVADALALSPHMPRRERPRVERRPVVIEDAVFVGANAAILKGVRVGAGAWIEPGSVVVRDVPAGARVGGNPAVVVAER